MIPTIGRHDLATITALKIVGANFCMLDLADVVCPSSALEVFSFLKTITLHASRLMSKWRYSYDFFEQFTWGRSL